MELATPAANAAQLGVMTRLKNLHSGIESHIPKDKPLIFFDYPLHLNIGDLLILQGTERFFADRGYEVAARSTYFNFDAAFEKRFPRDFTVVCHGGGNFGDLYPHHQKFREMLVERFPKHKIVFMPQTIHYGSQAGISESSAVLRRHQDLTIFVRDHASLSVSQRHFSERSILMPDMAHQLWQPIAKPEPSVPLRTLHLGRKDVEANGVRSASAASIDWIDMISMAQRRVHGLIVRLHRMEMAAGFSFGAQKLWYSHMNRLTNRAMAFVDRFDHVTTDRLHGCIASVLLQKQVTLLDNSYGKLGQYFEAWLSSMPNIHRSNPAR